MPRKWLRLALLLPYVAASSVTGLLIGFQQGLGRNLEIAWASGLLPGVVFVIGSVLCGLLGYRRGRTASTRAQLAAAVALTGLLSLATYWLSALLVGYALADESRVLGGLIVGSALTIFPVIVGGAPGLLLAAVAPPLIGRLDARKGSRRVARDGSDPANGNEFSHAADLSEVPPRPRV